jgi:hypothetical protein
MEKRAMRQLVSYAHVEFLNLQMIVIFFYRKFGSSTRGTSDKCYEFTHNTALQFVVLILRTYII